MSESFANKPPANADEDTFYTMGSPGGEAESGPSYLQREQPEFDFSNFLGTLAQMAQLYPGVQTKPQYAPGLTDLRFTRSFAGTGEDVDPSQFGGGSAGTRFFSPAAGPATPTQYAPSQYNLPFGMPEDQESDGGEASALMSLLGAMAAASGSPEAEAQRIARAEASRDITNFMPDFQYNPSFTPTFNPSYSPSNTFNPSFNPSYEASFDPTFNPTYAPSTDIDVSPTISPNISPTITQNPNIEVSPTITNTLTQEQQQVMGGSKTGQSQGDGGLDFDFDFGSGDGFDFGDGDAGFFDVVTDGGALDSDFFTNAGAGSGASDPYRTLVGLSSVNPAINQSPSIVVRPNITNTLSQRQAQWMGGGNKPVSIEASLSVSVSTSSETSVDTSVITSIITSVITSTTTSVDTSVSTTLSVDTTTTLSVDTTVITTVSSSVSVDTTVSSSVSVDTSVSSSVSASVVDEWDDDQLYIKSIYQELFERDADWGESEYWGDQLKEGKSREQIIRDIAAGALGNDRGALEQFEVDEFLGKQRTTPEQREANLQTVKDAYQTLFDRDETDPANLNYWATQLNLGKSPTDLLRDMVSGAQGADVQTAANTKTVNDLYNQLLDRPADEAGLDYFRAELAAGATPEEVARNIISGARAGDEASKISQEEYDRYFKEPSTQSAVDEFLNSLTPERLQQIQDSAYEHAQLTQELQNEARQYVYGMILTPGITPEQLREGFFRNVIASRPDLLEKLVGQSILDQYAVETYQGEGGITTTGTDTRSLSDEIIKRATDPDYIRAAINIASIFSPSPGKGADSGSGATAETAPIAGSSSALVTFGQSLLNGEDTDKAIANAATSAAVNAALYFGGPVVRAVYYLDSILAKEFGYDSPIQEGIAYFSRMIEKGTGWVLDKVSEFFGDTFDSISDVFNSIGDFLGFAEGGMVRYQEGGLVDLPGEMPYNYTNYYGALSQPQPYMPPLSLDEVQPEMAFAGGGLIPLVGGGKIASGPGGGLDDLIPTSIDGRRAAALSDGEFVIPADVVSMMGDGSSNAGAKRLYDMVRQVRQEKTGTSKQAGPLPVGKILERTMS